MKTNTQTWRVGGAPGLQQPSWIFIKACVVKRSTFPDSDGRVWNSKLQSEWSARRLHHGLWRRVRSHGTNSKRRPLALTSSAPLCSVSQDQVWTQTLHKGAQTKEFRPRSSDQGTHNKELTTKDTQATTLDTIL
uniref:Uncharacterized protein n=1 Tax=Knipowitschia caucasica TaxID=637954 RepID=A0AAV2MH65_KNICA